MPATKEESLEILEARMKVSPDSQVFARLADGYRKKGDIARAVEVCKQGIGKHPSYVTGRIILGRCYLEQENYPEAIAEFTNVCRLDRRNQVAIKVLADIFAKQQFTDKAGDLYAYLMKCDPENRSLAHLASTTRGSGKDDIFQVIGIPVAPFQWPGSSSAGPGADTADSFMPAGLGDTMVDSPVETSEPPAVGSMENPVESADLPIFGDGEGSLADGAADAAMATPHQDGQIVEEVVESSQADDPAGLGFNDRMSMIFEDEEPGAVPARDALRDTAVLPSPGAVVSYDARPDINETFPSMADREERPSVAGTVESRPRVEEQVSGNDVSRRIEDLFGDSKSDEPTVLLPDSMPQGFVPGAAAQPEPVADLFEEPAGASDTLGTVFETPAEASPAGHDELFADPVREEISSPSGMDEPLSAVLSHPDKPSFAGQDDFGGISTTDILDHVTATDTPDFDSLPEDAAPEDNRGSDIALTADSAMVGLEDEGTDSMPAPRPMAEEPSMLEETADTRVTGADVSERLDDLFTPGLESGAVAAPAAKEETVRPDFEVTNDTTMILQQSDADTPAPAGRRPPIAAPSDTGGADLFTDTIKFSLASDLLGQNTGSPDAGEQPVASELFGEEPLFGSDTDAIASPDPLSNGLFRTDESTLSGLVTAAGEPFVEDIATTEPVIGVTSVSDDQVSGDDVAGKIDELFGGDDSEDAEETQTERRLGDTDFFEVQKEASNDAFEQTLSWDSTQLRAAAALPGQPAAASAEPVPVSLDEMPVTLDAFPDDVADAGATGDFYTVSGDTAAGGPVTAGAGAEGLDAIELEITPGTSHNLFLDEDLASDTIVKAVEAEFSDLPRTTPAAETTPSNPAADPFSDNGAGMLSDELTVPELQFPDDDAGGNSAANGDFYTVSGDDAGAISAGTVVQPEGLDLVELEAPLESQMVDDLAETAPFPEPAPSAPTAIYSIPDHVLTPTLADIYYRQGQPGLAIQIFRRLLELNPDNEKVADRLAEIEQEVRNGLIDSAPAVTFDNGKMIAAIPAPAGRKRSGRKKKVHSPIPKPLEGIHLKKKIREQFKTGKAKKKNTR